MSKRISAAIPNATNHQAMNFEMKLPDRKDLPVNRLAACFNNTSATYKFYWFLSILQSAEGGKTSIPKQELFARMVSNAWYTVNYFHISFGVQDKLQRAVLAIKEIEKLMVDDTMTKLSDRLMKTQDKETVKQLYYLDNQVPHWFLSPWFPKKTRPEIYSESQKFNEQCFYALFNDHIEINPAWHDYLNENVKVLKDFAYWNLVLFLQSKNPNVPDIPNKIIKPAIRNSLLRQRMNFWDVVIKELGSVNCIYTGQKLTLGNYAVEHFVPYNFVSHDLIWNLIPADKSFNSAKSDKLPPMNRYFNSFFHLQKQAVEIVKNQSPDNKFLEDYLTIFPDIDDSFTMENFRDRIQPLITIASNNGFEFLP